MGNCNCVGSAKCANASTPFQSKVIPGSSTSNSKASHRNSSGSVDRKTATGDVPGAAAAPPVASELKSFSMGDLRGATKNFGSSAYLGEGGFGCVYKGWIDEATLAPARPGAANAMMVAIKKLKKESFQGHREWLTEVTYLGELHHDNLVRLVGYCSDSDSNKLLVYEYMLRGSLENHLFRRGSGNQPPLPWATRVSIAADVARGLAFLHSRDVIFRDLKSSNVLLASDHSARLSDFGLARAGPTAGKSHVSTRVMGTRGYAAPEYVATGHLSAKSDVYGFGVVLLELMTGRRALDESRGPATELLVDWARPLLVGDRRKVIRVMDTRLGGQYNKRQAQEVAALALRCLNNDSKSRPSHFWAGLTATKKFFFPFGSFFIKDVAEIRFWENTWLGTAPLREQYPALYGIVQGRHKSDTLAQVLVDNQPTVTFRRDLVEPRLASWHELLQRLARQFDSRV